MPKIGNIYILIKEVTLEYDHNNLIVEHPIGKEFKLVSDVGDLNESNYMMYSDELGVDRFTCKAESFDEYFTTLEKIRDEKIETLLK